MVGFRSPGSLPANLPVDAYSLRLVTDRRLYDQGTLVGAAPSLAGLAVPGTLSANPTDLGRLGVSVGDRVKVISPTGTIIAPVTPDASIPEGTVVMAWNHEGTSPAALIDAGASVTEIRVETTS